MAPGEKPAAAETGRPNSPPDWSGAHAGDFIEYSFSASDMNIPSGSAHFRVRLQVLSADAKEVRVAVDVAPSLPMFERGLLVVMKRAPAGTEEDEALATFYGQALQEERERVVIGDTSIVCQAMGEGITSPHGPSFSGCTALKEPSLYLGGGLVSFSMGLMTIQGSGYTYQLELQAMGREPVPPREVPPLAFREGSGYERVSQGPLDLSLEKHTFHTRSGLVLEDEILWTYEEGAKPQRGDRVYQGKRLTRMELPREKLLLEYVWDLIWLSLHAPYPDKGRPAASKAMSVAGHRVQTWKFQEKWDEPQSAGEREAVYLWDPWAPADAPVEVRFQPLSSKVTSWDPGRRKEADTEAERTLSWH
ncbi:DUF6068 family protein [Hyalangium versicolor]|uniref:DUF6068 family protein n=1 Tax=Hyalangium versicolor TaxID=2861190 RepID=UPI0035A106B5